MKNAAIFKLKFNAPLHLGTNRVDYGESNRVLHSDTFYAAIYHAWAVLGGKMEDLAGKNGEPIGFACSSLFPFFEEKLFFPVPNHCIKKPEGSKKFEDVRFVDDAFFKEFQQKGKIQIDEKDLRGDPKRLEFATADAKVPGDFLFSQVYPRVKIPRSRTNERGEEIHPEPYYIERLFFREGAGLFCLCFFDDEKTLQRLEAALRFLGDEGLGTDRHVGNGLFEFETERISRDEFAQPDAQYSMNLSLFLPEKEGFADWLADEKDENVSFSMVKRGGWLTLDGALSFRKNAVRMFSEGCIFKMTTSVSGNSYDVKPNISNLPKQVENVWRTGRSIFLPVKF